jgi:UDP-N-acetylglucosamine--N-acetylmuramyl-(pentapeptide) pyrophosphoryl-undecaprenol N-acetylglucosamine transferase
MKRSVCIVFAGGGTGGHLFPGIAVAQALRERHPDWHIAFLGTARGIEARSVPKYHFDLHLLPVRALRGKGVRDTLASALQLPYALGAAMRLIRRLNPTVAVGVGGYAAGPAMLAASLLGKRTVILEQNAHAGITNRTLGYVANHILLAMPNAQLMHHKGAQVLGNPVRSDLLQVAQKRARGPQQFGPNRPLRLLVVGGSQGAHALNAAMMALLPDLAQKKLPIEVQHQTGVKDHDEVLLAYQAHGLDGSRVTPFIDAMGEAYARADVVLCRAGASTLSELGVVGLPSILVPYPSAADDHQTANAQVMVAAQAAHLVPQSALDAPTLLRYLEQWLATPSILSQMADRALTTGKPEAVQHIVAILEAEVKRVQR